MHIHVVCNESNWTWVQLFCFLCFDLTLLTSSRFRLPLFVFLYCTYVLSPAPSCSFLHRNVWIYAMKQLFHTNCTKIALAWLAGPKQLVSAENAPICRLTAGLLQDPLGQLRLSTAPDPWKKGGNKWMEGKGKKRGNRKGGREGREGEREAVRK